MHNEESKRHIEDATLEYCKKQIKKVAGSKLEITFRGSTELPVRSSMIDGFMSMILKH